MKQPYMQQKYIDLYTSEADALFRYCFLRVSDREQAMDIVQESFTKLWDNIVAGKEISNLKAFLFKIASNAIIDWYRKKKAVSLDGMTDADEDGVGFQVQDDSQSALEIGTEGRMMLDKIKELDPTYQQVVYLRFVEDLSPKEIAVIVNKPVNVVSVRINRGIQELRKLLNVQKE